jgi:hypothetical protein
MTEEKTEMEAFIEREAPIPDFLHRIMLAEDPVMAQFHHAGGLSGIRKIHELRQKVVATYGFAVLTREVVNQLIPYTPFIELEPAIGPTSCSERAAAPSQPIFAARKQPLPPILVTLSGGAPVSSTCWPFQRNRQYGSMQTRHSLWCGRKPGKNGHTKRWPRIPERR